MACKLSRSKYSEHIKYVINGTKAWSCVWEPTEEELKKYPEIVSDEEYCLYQSSEQLALKTS